MQTYRTLTFEKAGYQNGSKDFVKVNIVDLWDVSERFREILDESKGDFYS